MLKLLREWGFPVGLGTLWVIALVYTMNSISGLPLGKQRPGSAAPAPAQLVDPLNRS
jgi:hypothetical protein